MGGRAARGARRALSTFLGVAGAAAVVIGLLYLFASGMVPHLIHGGAHGGHHLGRAAGCLAGGGACVVVSWLIRPRPRH
jgi:hypothetical protein